MFVASPAMADKKDDIIKRLSERLDKVEKELSQMKGETTYLKEETANIKRDTNEQLDELNDRADDNEFQAALNKVKFGFDMDTSVHFLDGEMGGEDVDAKEKWTSVFHLNMNANINDRTKFTGRVGVSRNWSDYTVRTTNDYEQGRSANGGTALYLERAYIDYKILDNFIITIGRQPGSDGPGSNLKNNSVRQATYPSLIFNANGDGVVLTYKPDIPGLTDEAVRLIYAKMYQWDNDASFVGTEEIEDARIYGAMFETKLPLGSMGDNLMILWGARTNDLTINPTSLDNLSMNVGDLTYANLYFENNHAFGSNLSYFVSGAYMKGSGAVDNYEKIQGKLTEMKLNDVAAQYMAAGMDSTSAIQAAQSKINETARATADGGASLNEEDAWALNVGARYDFTDTWKLGYSYFHGSKYWYGLQASNASDPLRITQTRGDAHDIYVIYQIDLNQFFRLSYTHIDYDYTNWGSPVGGAVKSDDDVSDIMLTYNVRF